MAFKFEQLKVWQRSIELSGEIFELTKKFPREEVYVLTAQLQRASDSIALNIAEGSTGQSNKEFKRFLGIAIRSAIEVVCCFYLARRRHLVNESQFSYFYGELSELIKGMQALRKSIKS
jgi:four helix bundle protein